MYRMSKLYDEVSTKTKLNKKIAAWELIKSGNSDKLRELLNKREISNINACVYRDGQMSALLTTASKLGQLQCVNALLEHGANKDILCGMVLDKSRILVSSVYLACFEGHIEVVKLLLEHGAPLNSPTCAPLCGACRSGNTEIARFLIDQGADVNLSSALNRYLCTSPLAAASRCGIVELVEYLIDKGADIHCTGDQLNPLIEGCSNGHIEVMEVLLSHGADINICTEDILKTTCIYVACINNSLEMVKFLLDRGADVTSLAFATAFNKRNIEVITLLLEHGADPDSVRIETPLSPLMSAVTANDIPLMTLLLKYGGNVTSTIQTQNYNIHIKYIKTSSSLIIACEHGCIDAVKLLLEHGADVNQLFNNYHQNDTTLICLFRDRYWAPEPLHADCVNDEGYIDLTPNQLACLKLLLEHGADVTVLNSEGKTVFDYVKDRPGTTKLLNEYIDTEPILK